jgi:hypothetical protein
MAWAGESTIRGINIQKMLTGFADEDTVLKQYCNVTPTSAREIRWYQKTAGFIAPATTTGITSNLASNTAARALAPVAAPNVTRNTSYVRKYYMKSELISIEDEADTDVDVLMTMIRDTLRGIGSQVDTRIYNVGTENLSPSTINTAAAAGTGWDDATSGDPIGDILTGLQKIRSNGYKVDSSSRPVLYINTIEHLNLMKFLINTKGSSIPNFSSEQVRSAVVMGILGCDVVVSENATTDYAWLFLPNTAVAWKQFVPLTSEVERVVGVGKIVHVWEEGEALLEHPKASHLITDTVS